MHTQKHFYFSNITVVFLESSTMCVDQLIAINYQYVCKIYLKKYGFIYIEIYIFIYIHTYIYIIYIYIYLYKYIYIYIVYIYIYIYIHLSIFIYVRCFIIIDVCAEAMEQPITTPTLYLINILVTRTIFFAYF